MSKLRTRKRVVLIVLDGLGIGALPDAEAWGDLDSNTLGHLAAAVGGLSLPHLARYGLGRLGPFQGVRSDMHPIASFGRMAEGSSGKDTLVGHWEMMGVLTKTPFRTYPEGFPPEVLDPFEEKIGRRVLGNRVASGTDIIRELGRAHMETGCPILYTSADSVFQLAAHESVIALQTLYAYCRTARDLLTRPPHRIARVIARPFVGMPGSFVRTDRRCDFALPPPAETLLDRLSERGIPVIGIGKIDDIFSGQGLSETIHTRNNEDGIDRLLHCLDRAEGGLIFINLVDFDMLYGHRNDPVGYAAALQYFDRRLPEIQVKMAQGDWLMITADHGNDPLFPGTDHTREYVPLLAYGVGVKEGKDLGTRKTFADVGQTLAAFFGLPPLPLGKSFLPEMI
ncbi:MAG: phosphopentomutase [Nitrospiria bacterium]